MKDFRDFLLRGNLVTTAVAFVMGPGVRHCRHRPRPGLHHPAHRCDLSNRSFGELSFTLHHSVFLYGHFLSALIAFVVIAAVLFFLVVKPVNALMDRMKTEPPVDETVMACPHCLSSIPAAASVCSFCTRDVGAAAAV